MYYLTGHTDTTCDFSRFHQLLVAFVLVLLETEVHGVYADYKWTGYHLP